MAESLGDDKLPRWLRLRRSHRNLTSVPLRLPSTQAEGRNSFEHERTETPLQTYVGSCRVVFESADALIRPLIERIRPGRCRPGLNVHLRCGSVPGVLR